MKSTHWFVLFVLLFGASVPLKAQSSGAGSALSFDGVNDHVVIASNASLTLSNRLTFEAWVYPTESRCNTILSRGDGGANTDYIFQVGYDGVSSCTAQKVSFWAAGAWDVSSNTVPLNTWTHVAVTFDGTNKLFYINGVLDRTVARAGTLFQSGSPLYIGRQGTTCNCNFYKGQLDEVRVWNVVRSAAAISQNKNSSLSTNQTGMIAYYRLDEGTGTNIVSSSAGAVGGVLTNGVLWVTSTAPIGLPVVTAAGASNITTNSATLSGTVNPNSQTNGGWFQYGTTTNYGSTTATTAVTVTNIASGISNAISGLSFGTLYHFRVAATNSAGTNFSSDSTFTTAPIVPTVTTQAATGVTSGTATLNANVNPNGGATTVYFQYGTTTNYGSVTATSNLAATNSTLAVNSAVSGLSPVTLYHFRVVATNSAGTNAGGDLTFTTAAAAPTAFVQAAADVTTNSATFYGIVNPNGAATVAYFEYGMTTNYGNVSSVTNLPATNSVLDVSNNITGLFAGTVYYYRLVATNSIGTAFSGRTNFTTVAVLPTAATLSATNVTTSGALLQGSVNPNNSTDTSVRFEYGVTTNYGTITSLTALAATNTSILVSNSVSGLLSNTIYNYRIVASNSAGSVFGTNETFATFVNGLGTGLQFDGIDDYIQVASNSSLTVSNRLTLEAWVKPAAAKCNTIVSRGDGGGTNAYIFQVGYDGSSCGVMKVSFFGVGAWDASTSTVPLNAWTHVAVTFDGTNKLFYINGVLDRSATRAGTLLQTGLPLLIGMQGSTCQCNEFKGALREIRVWNIVRTANEIKGNLGNGLTGDEPGLIAYYPLNDATGTTASDGTTNGNIGTLFNGPEWLVPDTSAPPAILFLTHDLVASGTVGIRSYLNPNYQDSAAWYEYGPTTNYGSTTPVVVIDRNAGLAQVTNLLSDLMPGIQYHYRLVATNSGGTNLAKSSFFAPGLPQIVSQSEFPLSVSATLQAQINPEGAPTSYYFEYGHTTNYGSTTATIVLNASNTNVAGVGFSVNGLDLASTYHCRLVLSNIAGVTIGDDRIFNTTGEAPVLSLSAISTNGPNVILNGTVSPRAADTMAWFEWGNGTLTNKTPMVAIGNGTNSVPVNADLINLPYLANYQYRLVASNAFGIRRSYEMRFWRWPMKGANPQTNECHIAYVEPGVMTTILPVLAVGATHTLALKMEGTVTAWGGDTNGQAVVPSRATNVIAIAAGLSHSMALRGDGTVVAWGNNLYGQTNVPAVTNFVAISAGAYHSLGLKKDGTVAGWGLNNAGQLLAPGFTNYIALAAGAYHSLGLRSDGTIVGWGSNTNGQRTIPFNATNVIAIAAGAYHSMALRADGTVLVWGTNNFGQTNIPAAATNIVAIAAGDNFCLALKAPSGSLIAWGDNSGGQTNVTASVGIATIAANGTNTFAVSTNGGLFSSGANTMGQRNVPGGLTFVNPPTVTGTVDVNTPGTYVLTYNLTNITWKPVTRTVVVKDTQRPTITLVGSNPLTATAATFSDPGATANDLCAGVLTPNITVNSTVDTSVPGSYTIEYIVTDPSGNSITNTRTVNIVTSPSISGYSVTIGTNTSTGTPIATVYATVNPNGLVSTTWLDFGLTTGYGSATLSSSVPASFTNTDVSYQLNTLLPGATYHYRVGASNSVGAGFGTDQAFSVPLAFIPGDLNGDGVVSVDELNQALSNHWSQASVYMTNPATLGGGVFQFGLTNLTGWNFNVQVSTNLIDWTNLPTSVSPVYQFLDPEATNAGRVYRLR